MTQEEILLRVAQILQESLEQNFVGQRISDDLIAHCRAHINSLTNLMVERGVFRDFPVPEYDVNIEGTEVVFTFRPS
jgi:hypothetical protein